MRHIQASEAKTHLPSLLDEVERGETLIITRHGKPIARLVPDKSAHNQEVEQAIAKIRELRKSFGKMSIEEIIASKHEGHRY
jgi:prevent-host-death family protein